MSQKLKEKYLRIRQATMKIVAPLETEDFCIQPAPHVSPPKWHLAHTTWFFERLILEERTKNYKSNHPEYYHLFNSYYKSLGSHWIRADRGSQSRPTVREIVAYREEIDRKMVQLLESGIDIETESVLNLGLNHEQQHQELLLMDINSIFFHQYGGVSYLKSNINPAPSPVPFDFVTFDGGVFEAGMNQSNDQFVYDNEGPKHTTWVNPFKIANRLVTNREYLEFVKAGGYKNSEFWLSDGWNWVNESKITAPLYWVFLDHNWHEFTFNGLQPLDLDQPVKNVSYYEAQAYARFLDSRLPTEFEWEFVAQKLNSLSSTALFLKLDRLQPNCGSSKFEDLHGSLWQWTQSSYLPYPGHQWIKGPLGEYNSKFMVNQMVLRGGCFATEADHYRHTYRNFFYPNERWFFSGIRLARDMESKIER